MSTSSNQLPISVVVNVSVATPQTGATEYNTSNIAIFSRDSYGPTFGTGSYKIYLSASQVATDFGSSSATYLMALQIFSQQPNILNNQGYLVVIPFLTAAQDQQVLVGFNGNPASGNFYIAYNGVSNITSAIAHGATASTVQTDLQSLTGISSATCTGSILSTTGLSINSEVSGVGHPFTVYNQYLWTVSSANATTGAVYSDSNGNDHTVQLTIAGQTTLTTASPSGVSGTVPVSGTLTKVSGTGDTTITYSAWSTLSDSNSNPITISLTVVVPGSTNETLDQAILRTQSQVQYFGVMANEVPPSQTYLTAAASLIQTLNKIGFFTSFTSADVQTGGLLASLASGGYTQSRAVPYLETNSANQPYTSLEYMASYASELLSVNYGGSLTTITMNLKSLSGVQADPGLTTTLYNSCQSTGCDVYANIQGIPKVLISGANDYSDNQVNLQWFAGAVQVAYFNALATTNTKVPQTENGINTIKAAIQQVCQQAVSNGFVAPGTWNSPTYFGNPALLTANIAQFGYYIYSSPIASQLQSVRVQRISPLIQIAVKYAGALQSGSAIIYINQ